MPRSRGPRSIARPPEHDRAHHPVVGGLHSRTQAARDVYTRRGEGLSIWVVPSVAITASDPADKDMLFEPAVSKIYRHPTFYEVPDEVDNM